MKKVFLSILIAGALFTSCDMNELPAGTLSDETAIQTEKDAMKFRNGIYNSIRSLTGGGYIAYPDIQADLFIGTVVNGNRIGPISAGNINSSTQEFASFWSGPYSSIADVNYFLPKVESLMAAAGISDADRISLQRYRGEAHWARAFFYYFLADHYCNSYNVGDPNAANTGVPLITEYKPTGDYTHYKGRSTLAETFALVERDLEQAYSDLEAYEKSGVDGATANLASNASYLSTYTVLALQARVALLKGDYDTAIAKAEKVISGPYELSDYDEYLNMWVTDAGKELIFVPYGDSKQGPSVPSTGSAWLSNFEGVIDYVPSSDVLGLYSEEDVRNYSFFDYFELKNEGQGTMAMSFIKFPGNPVFNTGSDNAFKNKPKPFRLSEMYLIVAEAAAAKGNATDKANAALNAIRKARIEGYNDQSLSGTTLINEIRMERAKELIGEGFRISDLRRWGLGFTRPVNYSGYLSDLPSVLIPSSVETVYQAGDYRYVLPIPVGEMDSNPQLKGHQNPGY